MKNRRTVLVIITLCFFLNSCGLRLHFWKEHEFTGQKEMHAYAEERYLSGLDYMKQGRYELASQQFSIAADTATTQELQDLAQEGYQKATSIIDNQQ